MKKQDINLYKSLPHISRNWFSELMIFQLAGAFLALLVVITVFQVVMLGLDKHQASALQKKYTEMNMHFTKDQKDHNGLDLIKLQQELASKKQLLDLLHIKSEEGSVCSHMSDYFKSLSALHMSGIWLTRIRIEPATRNMIFEGETHDPILIMELVKKMGKTDCFSGIKFRTINIENSANGNAKTMVFAITSVTASPKTSGGK